MRYQITPMSIRHYDRVLRLWQATEGLGLGESDTRCQIARFLGRNRGLSQVAHRGNEIVGAVLCGHDGRRGYLHHLAVSRQHRRNGIGQKLVATCLGRLKSLGIVKCNIFLFADNRAGKAFWTRNGWITRTDLHLAQKPLRSSRDSRSC